ncbi:transcriptional regulator [Sphaerisporangium rufum]|uniref:Transcriptional regulator n=1 Tax=Sphaerisporangium rufum TaxID=1381558 RepID=A0A919R6P9_9ACTN|nr:helix-turn-helix transcriptional regulator [Sphaerisporangium rufum]GII78215.1 transcriptional regulator [Sphaerisporangium rufum]
MPRPIELHPEASPLALFGYELRRHRQAARLTQRQLAAKIVFSTSMVGMVERGLRRPEKAFAQRCDAALQLDGVLTRLSAVARRETDAEHFRSWLDIEQEAITLHTWDPLLIPGLFQTKDYARRVMAGEPGVDEESAEQLVDGRVRRLSVLARPQPATIFTLIDEGVLHRPVGGPAGMREQLDHLLGWARHPLVTVQVVPYCAESTCGLLSAFVLAELHDSPCAAYVDCSPRGRTIEDPETVAQLVKRYDAIRTEAYPRHMSLKAIEEAARKWT